MLFWILQNEKNVNLECRARIRQPYPVTLDVTLTILSANLSIAVFANTS